jgi:hypothetical protein
LEKRSSMVGMRETMSRRSSEGRSVMDGVGSDD